MGAHILQLSLAEPGIRTHMHRLHTGHKTSEKPGCEGDIEIPGLKGYNFPRCIGPRNRQRDALTAMP
jgi:hypothetical protein